MTRKHIQHYRNGKNTRKPTPTDLEYGEFAVTYLDENEKIYIRTSANKLADFSSDHIIHSRINEQDLRLSNVLGLSATTESDNKVAYTYTPTNTMITSCTTISDSVECVADNLRSCLSDVTTLKYNYPLDIEVDVVLAENSTTENITYTIKRNGEFYSPKQIVVIKRVDDGASSQIYASSSGDYTGTFTNTVEGSKETYIFKVTPNLEGGIATTLIYDNYLFYVGANSGETVTKSDVTSKFKRLISNNRTIKTSVDTTFGQYIYIAIPNCLAIESVTDSSMPVTVEKTDVVIDDFNIYKSLRKLISNTWNLKIKVGDKPEEPLNPNQVIYYEASAKLSETTSNYSSGLHTNAFGTATITSHTFENGVGKIIFDNDVTSIGNEAFKGCSSLSSITIPDSVTSIGDSAFGGCYRLSSVTIGNSVTSIGDSAFGGCEGLTSITIGNSVTSIGDRAFENCYRLSSVTIPDSVTSIGDSAFGGCEGLTSITIGNSVTSIDNYAFLDCYNAEFKYKNEIYVPSGTYRLLLYIPGLGSFVISEYEPGDDDDDY